MNRLKDTVVLFALLGLAVTIITCTGEGYCVYTLPLEDKPTESHNALGGYIPACGNRAGIIGDDC